MNRLFLVLFSSILLYSCGIDVPEIETKLKTPLGLTTLSTPSNTIILEWWGYNDEEYFSGYVIFISQNYDEIADITKPPSQKPKLLNENNTVPTISLSPATYPRLIRVEITKDINNIPLLPNIRYYFAVAAYSISKNIYSPLSNITNGITTNF